MHRKVVHIFLIPLTALGSVTQAKELSEESLIALLTCTPGKELYARYGHTAILVHDTVNGIDEVYNYGLFDFDTEHFYWKFVRGETWYELGYSSLRSFAREYQYAQRDVYIQVLNLTIEQRNSLWHALAENALPENSKYLYNFVFDNCATRPYQLIANTLGDSIVSDYKGHCGDTYRRFIRQYTGKHSWENAGINLLFGCKADKPMSNEQRLFLPEELMLYIENAQTSEGKRLVRNSHIGSFKPVSTPWYASWEFGLILYFLVVSGISIWDRVRGKWSWWVELIAGIPYCILLLIVAFLTFFSWHPLVGFGWRLLIIPLVHLCARSVYLYR